MAIKEIRVPDLEGSTDVGIVEVYISIGDVVEPESPLISLESDKAVLDIPSPLEGTITEIKVSQGDAVNTGDLIALAESGVDTPPAPLQSPPKEETKKDNREEKKKEAEPVEQSIPVNTQSPGAVHHATPSVRSLARELGVDLSGISGSGPKGRITREDVTSQVKGVMTGTGAPASPGAFSLPPIPSEDYSAFGEVENQDLSRIQKISGPHLHRNWMGIPHVFQFEETDITELESFRKELNETKPQGNRPKISLLVFVIRAAIQALKSFPDFNSSLSADGASIIRKKYYNIGIAVDTPDGLVVPVIKDAHHKGILELVEELSDLSSRAREGKLKVDDLKGGTFTISSLGGIGGTYFTPIVPAPQVAILGLSRSAIKPIWNGKEFRPRLILPFSVSYDHRVIDGAKGARFAAHLSVLLGDMRRALL